MDNNSTISENILNQFGGIAVNDLSRLLETRDDDFEPNAINQSSYFSANEMPSFVQLQNNNYTLLSLNTQSVNAKISKLELFIQQMSQQNIFIDAIAIQESWLQYDDHHELSDLTQLCIDGYTIISQGYSCSKHGGLMFYIRSDYTAKIIKSVKNSDVWEGLFIEVTK